MENITDNQKLIKNQKIMVLDTEYDTNPKRLLAISYIIYTFDETWNKTKYLEYIKHPENVFKVDEEGHAFEYHKLTNKFLQENGVDIKEVLENFYNNLSGIDVIVGQNIITADIQIIRKESIPENLWFGKIRDILKNIPIYDTMISFKDKNPEEKCSLDSIYKFLFDKEMKNHHNPVNDCKNTFKCFERMNETEYIFNDQRFNYSEDIFAELMKKCQKCDLCESKIPEGNNIYKFINKDNIIKSKYKSFSIITSPDLESAKLILNTKICKKYFSNLEILIRNDNDKMLNITKIKMDDSYVKEFFEIIGDESIIVYLESQYKDKDEIKKLGGKWDGQKKAWYFTYTPKTTNRLIKFKQWIN